MQTGAVAHAGLPGRGQGGVTLIELLVVLAIIGLLAAIAAPTLTDYRTTRDVNNAVRQMVSELQLVKTQAVFKNREYRIEFGTPSAGQYEVRWREAGSGTTWAAATVSDTLSLPAGIKFGDNALVASGPEGNPVTADGITFPDNDVVLRGTGSSDETGTVYFVPEKDVAEGRKDRMRAVMLKFSTTAKVKAYRYTINDEWSDF